MSDDLDREVPRIKDGDLEKLEGKHGILLRHIRQIQRYNRRLNWLIMLRPINRDVAGKLHAGSRGKIISIKGKSSEFIFLAGDIPFEAGLSKLGNKGEDSDWGKIEHFNSVNRKSIEGQNEKSINEQKEQINKFRNKIAEFSNKNEDFPVEIEAFSKNIEDFSKKIKIQAEIEIIRAKIQFAQKKRDSSSENLLLEFKQQLKKQNSRI